jgi:site-specific DNA-cytosine methylase
VDRLRGLGNAIVPQIAEWIARRILEAEVTRSQGAA